jgi:hypothetical protein
MDLRLDGGGVAHEQIEHIMALVLVGANNAGVDRNMIGDQRIGDDPFLETEIFGGVAGVESRQAALKLLAIAARMDDFAEIIVLEDREGGNGIADTIVGRFERFRANEILGGPGQRLVGDIRDLAHASQAHIGLPGDQACPQHVVIRHLFSIAAQDMIEPRQKLTGLIDKMQEAANIDLAHRIEDRMVDRLTATRILQGPADAIAATSDLEVGIFFLQDAVVHGLNAFFQQPFERCEVVLDRLEQNE